MFKNYLLLTLRTIKKDKISAMIAIIGLAIGLTSTFLLYNYIEYHLNYEQYIGQDNNIKRLTVGINNSNQGIYYKGDSTINLYSSKNIEEEILSIEEVSRMTIYHQRLFHVNYKLSREYFTAVSPNFFDMLTLPFSDKVDEELFKDFNSIVVDKHFADIYFQGENPIGKELTFHDDLDYILIVKGVVNIPKNSHLYRDYPQVFISEEFLMQEVAPYSNDARSSVYTTIYFSPIENYQKDILLEELQLFINNIPQPDSKIVKIFYEDIKDIHLFSKVNSNDANNPLYMVIFLSVLTIALLLTSIVNSISILTANSMSRAKEFGVRKVIGGEKKDLFIQLIFESIIFALISLFLAIIFYELFQISFSNIVEIDLEYSYTTLFLIYSMSITLIVGLLAGLLPAYYLSTIKVTSALLGNKLIKIRKSKIIFVTIQFIFASIILIWSITVNRELNYIKNLDLGFNSDNLIIVAPQAWDFNEQDYDKLNRLRYKIMDIDGVESVTYTSFAPMFSKDKMSVDYRTEDQAVIYEEFYSYVDAEYFNTLGIPISTGEVIKNSVVAMTNINRYREMDIGITQVLDSETYNVSALIDNYFLETALNGEKNYFHIVSDHSFKYQIIKISKSIDVSDIRSAWKEILPEYYYLEYSYINENIYEENLPAIVITIIKVINIITILTLLLSLLGLFGIILHSVQHKTKEVGIRKVLGAKNSQIIKLFVKETLLLLIVSMLIGLPLGILTVKNGLCKLGYNLPIHNLPLVVIVTILALTFTALIITVSIVYRTSITKPINALRYE